MDYTFHCVLSQCTFHFSLSFYDCSWKKGVSSKQFIVFSLKVDYRCDPIKPATSKNDEQYIFSSITYITLQNFYFSFEVFLEGVFLKDRIINLTISGAFPKNLKIQGLYLCQKYATLSIFKGFCLDM